MLGNSWILRVACACALWCGVCLPAQALQHEVREAHGFTTVHVAGAIDLVITQNDSESLTIEAEDDQISRVQTKVENGELTIAYKPGWSLWSWFRLPSQAPRALLSLKTVTKIALEGSGDIHAGVLTSQDKLELVIAGSGDIHIDTLAAKMLDVRIAGSGDVQIAGAALEQRVRIAGAGDYKAPDLKSINSTISINGAGDVVIWVRDKLNVSIAGVGEVSYWGSPLVTRSISGAGDVKALGVKD